MASGEVVGIYIAAAKGMTPAPVQSANAVAGKGLEGDRYFGAPRRSPSSGEEGGREVTLIEAEAFEHIKRENGIELQHCEGRRNIVTRGIALNDLVGREFTVGGAKLRAVRLCHPCGYLEKKTKPGVKQALDMRGGLRCDVVEGGTIKAGDRVEG